MLTNVLKFYSFYFELLNVRVKIYINLISKRMIYMQYQSFFDVYLDRSHVNLIEKKSINFIYINIFLFS